MKIAFLFVLALILTISNGQGPARPPTPPLVKLLTRRKFTILLALLRATGAIDGLAAANGITLFAPTNMGFRKTARALGCKNIHRQRAVINCLGMALKGWKGVAVLQYHVVTGVMDSEAVLNRRIFPTLFKDRTFKRNGLVLMDRDTAVVDPKLIPSRLDMRYKHGIVHAIDAVLLPISV